jgi:hypothetical protein
MSLIMRESDPELCWEDLVSLKTLAQVIEVHLGVVGNYCCRVLDDAFLNILFGFVLRLESGLEAQSTAFIDICALQNGCLRSQESWLNLSRSCLCYHY